ncbi:hypothetical protein CKO11_15545 [Rhodobacter sp. TJ_12]|uniref:hypothetical protein n=1 Tax=Rhodobacter sp. TJ_12 TaxID=2029399 RepID=UPI001CC07E00|nr:hypothetical protein [Rhodobacter sp. TJ_12]MBZ4023866.1 hypothetical protein [Rhodobacter sp. TJ_12]
MLALFIALSCAIALVLWAEWHPSPSARRSAPAPVAPLSQARQTPPPAPKAPEPATEEDDAIMARVAQILTTPEPVPTPLPRVTGFCPGDVIELEIEGPLPRAEDLRIDQIGPDARLVIEGFPALIIEATHAATLPLSAFRFRGQRAA